MSTKHEVLRLEAIANSLLKKATVLKKGLALKPVKPSFKKLIERRLKTALK